MRGRLLVRTTPAGGGFQYAQHCARLLIGIVASLIIFRIFLQLRSELDPNPTHQK